MANIYNETMLKYYKNGIAKNYYSVCDKQKLYKGYMWKPFREFEGGFYSKNCLYGYAHYNPKTNDFRDTLGYKGFLILDNWFKLKQGLDGTNIGWDWAKDESIYIQMLKDLKLKYNWYETDLRTKQAKKLKEKLKSAVMLYFKL